jgi:hypothetical protein
MDIPIRFCCVGAESTRGERFGEMREYSRAEERYIPQYGLVNFFSTVSEPSKIKCPAKNAKRRFAVSITGHIFKMYLCSSHARIYAERHQEFVKTKGEAYAQMVTEALSPN